MRACASAPPGSGIIRAALAALALQPLLACAGVQAAADRLQPAAETWSPPFELRSVPVRWDCGRTRHRVGVTIQPNFVYPHGAIFLCPERARTIEAATAFPIAPSNGQKAC